MKKIYFVALTVILAVLASCSKDSETALPDPNVDFIQTSTVEFDGLSGGEHSITFKSPKPWIAEIHQKGSWLKGAPLHGNAGESNIVLSPRSDNFSIFSREATVEIYVDGYQAYSIKVSQKSASTSDIKVEGHIDGDGVMTLVSDEKGTMFSDTVYVTSSKQWTLDADAASKDVLSFETKEISQDGANKTTQLVVTADYAKFSDTAFSGKFYIKTSDGGAVPVIANAQSAVAVYETNAHMQGEQERASYNLVDTIQHGVFQTTFYVDANVRWALKDIPEWVEVSEASLSNIKADGTISKDRHAVTMKVKSNKLSVEGKTGTIKIVDDRNKELSVVNIIFAGTGNDYIDFSLSWPATDANGSPWAFEAHESDIDAEGPINRRRISLDFTIVTSANYSTIANAPFHLLMVDGTNGIVHKKEHHWATLKMGDASDQTKTEAGMYQKKLYIVANERGDADDTNGVTKPSESRNAFIYIVPNNVTFNDLWNADGTLKSNYADNLVLIAQKNDPYAEYRFALEGLADGDSFTVNPAGESKTFNVAKDSYTMCDIDIAVKNSDGEWVSTSDCTMSNTFDEQGNTTALSFSFTKNAGKYDPFKKQWTGSDRIFRIQVKAFINDTDGYKVIYTIYANQSLSKE